MQHIAALLLLLVVGVSSLPTPLIDADLLDWRLVAVVADGDGDGEEEEEEEEAVR